MPDGQTPRFRLTRIDRRIVGLCTLLAAWGSQSSDLNAADLVWNTTEATLKVGAGQKSAVAEFAFRNAGTKAVSIIKVAPSCSCVTAKADKAVYVPGESGIVRVEFAVEGREGIDEKSVSVFADDAPEQPKRLHLTVEIPESVAIRPRAVFWKTGESVSAKEIEIVLAESEKTKLISLQCTEPSFSADLKPLPERGHYQVLITPTATGKLAQATIRLNATVEGQPRVFVLYAAIK